ncbi:MAG: glycyl-radical enzyme activating protein [bacterium]|nr:glycyl-radical enzyme activating protein [bacterium]
MLDSGQTKPYAVGLDIGGTKIAAGVLDRELNLLSICITKEHAGQLPAQVVDSIEKAYRSAIEESGVAPDQLAGVGLSFAGHTHGREGVVLTSSNMPQWDRMPLRDVVAKRLDQFVLLDNDANLGAMAEHRYGAGRGASDIVYVTFSTGVGMGIIVDGKLAQGHTGTAGEVGHTVVVADGRRCSCGKRGCLMAYASGIALRTRAWERLAASEETALRDLAWDDPKLISGEQICEVARKGDPAAQDLIISTGKYLGICLSTIVQVLNPEVIVIGGGLTNIGSMLLDPCMESLRQNIHPVLWGAACIVAGRFQQNVSVIGGAAMVFSETESAEAIHRRIPFVAPTPLDTVAPALEAKPLSTAERQRLEKVEGTVFDLQRYSLHDGPGLRTSVFLKGCALRCGWCSNPESQHLEPQLTMFAANCLACGSCVEVCTPVAREVSDGRLSWNRELCNQCGECVKVCPSRAMGWTGKLWTAGSVVHEALADAAFYSDGGGITLTGGEPTLQPAFAEAIVRLAKHEGLHTAIETTGNAPWEVLEMLLPYLDLWLYDLKHMDSKTHRDHTGLGNELILSNLRKLSALEADLRVRMPLIPGVNLTDENLDSTATFVSELGNGIRSVDLLPYHTLGRAKYEALGRDYPGHRLEAPAAADVEAAAQRLRSHGLSVRVVDET